MRRFASRLHGDFQESRIPQSRPRRGNFRRAGRRFPPIKNVLPTGSGAKQNRASQHESRSQARSRHDLKGARKRPVAVSKASAAEKIDFA